MKLLIASNNKHKIDEIKSILGNKFCPIVSLAEEKITCDPVENGKTFLENAIIKASEIRKYAKCAILADDTGLCVDALYGAPGVLSARYCGDHDDKGNREKLLHNLQNAGNRSAHFETAVVLLLQNGEMLTASGRVDGYILEGEQGSNGFGYDSLFFSTELNTCFGNATADQKNSVSHRARALQNLLKAYEERKQH